MPGRFRFFPDTSSWKNAADLIATADGIAAAVCLLAFKPVGIALLTGAADPRVYQSFLFARFFHVHYPRSARPYAAELKVEVIRLSESIED